MFSAADKSGDNTLSFAEFLQAHRTGLSAKSANATIAKVTTVHAALGDEITDACGIVAVWRSLGCRAG